MLAAIVVTVVGFGLLGTPLAAAVGIVPLGALLLGGPLLAFVSGTLALVGVGGALGLAPLPSLLVLASFPLAAAFAEHGRRPAALYLAAFTACIGLFVLTRAAFDSLTTVTAVLVGTLVTAGYVLHRYELLTLGLIDE